MSTSKTDISLFFNLRTAVKAVAERVGQSAFFFAAQGFMEKDRTLFALLSAIEVRNVNLQSKRYILNRVGDSWEERSSLERSFEDLE